ncbi:MAG: glycoside hydrolase family 127 protein [Acidobacteria bacterium]|nr:glycoside hydrolase family 127 protein [Acidobacteriota bacterium]
MTAILYRSQVAICVLLLSVAAANGQQRPVVRDRIQREAKVFELDEVRLRESPFKRAMMRDAEYLLRLEPDRLLSWFRKEAGLKPKGEVYGGWEARGIAGHSLGHYLSACAMMFASTGDARFRERVSYIVNELEVIQRAHGNVM